MKLVGYTDRLSVAPGENISFMVSSEPATYRADVVELIHGDVNPAGPGLKARPVTSTVSGEYAGKYQGLYPGSYVLIPFANGLWLEGSFTFHTWIRATTPDKSLQTLISFTSADGADFAVRLVAGRLSVQMGRKSVPATVEQPVTSNAWYSVAVVHDKPRGEVRVSLAAKELTATRLSIAETLPASSNEGVGGTDVLIAAEVIVKHGKRIVGNFYNGKIDTPAIYARALSDLEIAGIREGASLLRDGVLAAWDFSQGISSTQISDVSGNGYQGRTVNRPTRAVAGHAWDGSEVVWANAPAQYSAIHFHEDDLDDAGWEKSLDWKVPDGLPSGIYALHLRGDGAEDYLPFVVRPKRGTHTASLVFLVPTFSYLAYGNSHIAARAEVASLAKARAHSGKSNYPTQEQDKYIIANRLNSLYDTHTDGSGCFYASWRRPIVSMRPKYVSEVAGVQVPHQLNADLHLVDWLVENGYQFDAITDENLHLEGRSLLDPYKVVLTGTHPEYWSEQMIRAAQQYLHGGGRMMYLGGNGMFWVTQLDSESGHTIEMRRAQPSTPRFFDPHPGELHLSTTGQRAAPWRNRGLPTEEWLGVVAAGAGRTGQHYERRPASFDPRVSWIFEGIGPNEPIGNFNNLHSGYGAAAGEVDRVDFTMEGTPHHTLILASSAAFDNSWFWDPVYPPSVPRADLALLEYPNGGAVFSASSIAWCSCLSHNGYHNNVSRLTRNVLEGFLSRRDPLGPKR